MDCTVVAGHLVAYHFATVSDEERDAVDRHLLGCTTCLASYLALKRATDTRPLERPAPAVKARLRAAVAAAYPPPATSPAPALAPASASAERRAPLRLLARRIPLYQGIAAAALAAAIALAVPTLLRQQQQRNVPEGAAQIDSARPRAESFQIY